MDSSINNPERKLTVSLKRSLEERDNIKINPFTMASTLEASRQNNKPNIGHQQSPKSSKKQHFWSEKTDNSKAST